LTVITLPIKALISVLLLTVLKHVPLFPRRLQESVKMNY